MGVNRAGFGIVDDGVVRKAAEQEIVRRHFRYQCEYIMGLTDKGTVERAELIMKELSLTPEDRRVVVPAREAAQEAMETGKGHQEIYCGAAVELRDGTIITGKNSPLMHAASSLVLNAIKHLASIPDPIHLIAPNVLESIGTLKKSILKRKSISLNLEETLIAISISATSNPSAQAAMEKLEELQSCEMHLTHTPTPGDEAGLRRLGVNATSDPAFSTKTLYVS